MVPDKVETFKYCRSSGKVFYPENPEVRAFIMKVMTDKMIYGQAVTRIDPTSFYEETDKEPVDWWRFTK